MADHDDDADEKVGYGRPPRANRFKPGQSGNPKGRPKGAKNIATIFDEEMRARVPVNVNGKRKDIELQRLMVQQLARKAAGGDLRAIGLALTEASKREAAAADRVSQDLSLDPMEEFGLTDLVERVRAAPLDDEEGN